MLELLILLVVYLNVKMIMQSDTQGIKFSTEWIIDQVRSSRNELIKSYLRDEAIVLYFREHYSIEQLRPVKVEFLKRDLRSFLISPVDLVHYSSLIKEVKESQDISKINTPVFQKLFTDELNAIFQKYTI